MVPYNDYYTFTAHQQRLEEANAHYAHPRPPKTRSAFLAQLSRGWETLGQLRHIRVRITFEVSETPSVRPISPEGC